MTLDSRQINETYQSDILHYFNILINLFPGKNLVPKPPNEEQEKLSTATGTTK